MLTSKPGRAFTLVSPWPARPSDHPLAASADPANEMIAAMIAQLQAFQNLEPDEKQMKHLRKAAKQFRKMGWPKTAIDAATWRKLHRGVELAPNEMTLREAGERNDVHLAKGMTP